jgi:uncharacterized membrane protein
MNRIIQRLQLEFTSLDGRLQAQINSKVVRHNYYCYEILKNDKIMIVRVIAGGITNIFDRDGINFPRGR